MEIVKDILLVTIPALLVLLTAYFLIRKTVENDREKRRHEIILQNSRTITPVRLQAYERLTLFLERISMESLIMRTHKQEMNAKKLQSALLATIRSEYDHNLAQQIYVSPQAWEVIKSARSNTIKIINTVTEKIPPTASSSDLSRNLLETVMEMDQEPARVALDFLKKEISSML
ncbi:MAG: hypothetical protein V2I34_06035 [Bacteroidales bacterium]|jgi:hypothetical protein|nr:hypothetical protein [Bacteroidales bacterium]